MLTSLGELNVAAHDTSSFRIKGPSKTSRTLPVNEEDFAKTAAKLSEKSESDDRIP